MINRRKTVKDIRQKKKNGQKIVMLTAYDYPFAQLVDTCGVDMILVGDSLANVVLGLESTREVGMAEMLHHAKAVNRGVKQALLIGDMPYRSYTTVTIAVKNARRFVDEAGCNAVKLEWFENCPEVAKAIVKEGIPVMGHVGLTPQTADQKGGFKLQGKDAAAAERIISQAKELQDKGCFSLVLECIPDKLAAIITHKSKIPTIGIGAGPDCDGQVLVTHDLLGLFSGFYPKFVKQYVNAYDLITRGIIQFRQEVENGAFPDAGHSYPMNAEELRKLRL
jgi:3-methyl-2-oxobutanoate hydroxymethyltransferase